MGKFLVGLLAAVAEGECSIVCERQAERGCSGGGTWSVQEACTVGADLMRGIETTWGVERRDPTSPGDRLHKFVQLPQGKGGCGSYGSCCLLDGWSFPRKTL